MHQDNRIKCPLCQRDILPKNISKHHVIPKSRGGRKTENICHTCHSQIHALFSNKELEQNMATIENLIKDSRMQKYLSWIKNINPDTEYKARKKRP